MWKTICLLFINIYKSLQNILNDVETRNSQLDIDAIFILNLYLYWTHIDVIETN